MKRTTIFLATADVTSSVAKKCIKNVKKYTKDYELIVIDNDKDLNFNHAREINRALSITNSKYVVLIDDDAFVSEGWLDALIECAKSDEKIGIVGAKILNRNGKIDHTGGYITSDGWYGTYDFDISKEIEVRWVNSSCVLLKRDVMIKIGGFDESFIKYFHDVDIGIRCWQHGYKVVVTPKCVITHIAEATIRRIRDDLPIIANKDRQTFFQKWIWNGKFREVFQNVQGKREMDR